LVTLGRRGTPRYGNYHAQKQQVIGREGPSGEKKITTTLDLTEPVQKRKAAKSLIGYDFGSLRIHKESRLLGERVMDLRESNRTRNKWICSTPEEER